MVTLTQTVTQSDSDLHLFFKELKNFAGDNYSLEIFKRARQELIDEITNKETYIFEKEKIDMDVSFIENITPKVVLSKVFNAETPSAIEYVYVDNKRNWVKVKVVREIYSICSNKNRRDI